MPKIFLSFDVEEFDMPLEYGQNISLEEQLQIGNKGMKNIIPIINQPNITTTLFTTATYAIHFPEQIKMLAAQHEIASHTFYHSSFEVKDLAASKLKLEEICGKEVIGLRMPRMRPVLMKDVFDAGYSYDSSINPTFLPGRYNNLHLPRTLYKEESIFRLPASVSPNFRIPLFWLAFKNMPYQFYKKLVLQTLRKDGYVCLYFHPWEFTNIQHYRLPTFAKRWSGEILQDRLTKLINDLKSVGSFCSIEHYIKQKSLVII